jgi:DNA-binding NarL/FixJ family response regulator
VRGRILIVDDDAGFRSALRGLLAAEGFEVAGEAADGSSALAAVRELTPDVVLLDIRLPDIDGFAVATQLAKEPAAPEVVLISSLNAADYGPRLNTPAVAGYIAKTDLGAESIDALLRKRPIDRRSNDGS